MNREKADHWLGIVLVALLMVQILCGILFTGMVRSQDFLIAQGLAAALLALWVARLWVSEKPVVFWPPACWCGGVFLVYAVVRTFGADIPYVARSELLRILVYATTFMVALQTFRSRLELRVALWTLVGLGVCSSLYAVFQSVVDPGHVWHFERPEEYGYGRRGSGFFINPNNLATQLALTLPVALAFSVLSRLKASAKVALGGCALVMVVGIGLTMSRGGWIASAFSLLFFVIVVVRMRGKRAAVIGVMAVLLGLGAFVVSQSELARVRLESALSREASGNVRYAIWGTALSMWKDQPILGVGPGHFDRRYRQYRLEELQMRPLWAHNDYIDALADWGALGLGIALVGVGLILVGASGAWRALRRRMEESGASRSDRQAWILGLTCSGAAWLVHILFDFPSHIPGLAMLAALLAALLVSQTRNSTSRFRFHPGTSALSGLTALGIAVGLYLSWQAVSRYREYRALDSAVFDAGGMAEAVDLLKQARRIEPDNPDTPFLIGEAFRLASWDNPPDYTEKAEMAIDWFARSLELDPYDPVRRLRLAQCLDWLDRPDEAWPYYEQALDLDPRGYHTTGILGWHFAHLGELEKARIWYEKSIFLQPGPPNAVAWEQLRRIDEALAND